MKIRRGTLKVLGGGGNSRRKYLASTLNIQWCEVDNAKIDSILPIFSVFPFSQSVSVVWNKMSKNKQKRQICIFI